MSQPYKYIYSALDKRFNLSKADEEGFACSSPDIEWSHNCLVTQDWDELNEYIFANELTIPDTKRPAYFTPQSKWSCLLLPKIKIRWDTRVKQIKLGSVMYNMLDGTWSSGWFIPTISCKDCCMKISPYYTTQPDGPGTVLIPFKTYNVTHLTNDTDIVPILTIADEVLQCVYAAVHFNISFNRQGLYINRKYREKTEQVQVSDLPATFTIIEPGQIDISFKNSPSLLKINLV